jgi:hypothetical protein
VAELMSKSQDFARHIKPVEDLYTSDGRLKSESDPTCLGRLHGELHFFPPIDKPAPIVIRDYHSNKNGPRQHLMLDFDSDDDEMEETAARSKPARFIHIEDSDDSEHEKEARSIHSGSDVVEPIVISSDEDDDEHFKSPSQKSKKRKR